MDVKHVRVERDALREEARKIRLNNQRRANNGGELMLKWLRRRAAAVSRMEQG